MNHPIRCRCTALKGTVSDTKAANRGVCYCKDCQAFAHFLNRNNDILDERGGTQIVQTLPKYVHFTEGLEHLACMRLTEKGLLRWYTTCCNTPIGNTPPNMKMSFVGIVHSCLITDEASLDDSFGPICMHVHTKEAKGMGDLKSVGTVRTILRFIIMMSRARLNGDYKCNPFFTVETGAPVVNPEVLSMKDRELIMRDVCKNAH